MHRIQRGIHTYPSLTIFNFAGKANLESTIENFSVKNQLSFVVKPGVGILCTQKMQFTTSFKIPKKTVFFDYVYILGALASVLLQLAHCCRMSSLHPMSVRSPINPEPELP